MTDYVIVENDHVSMKQRRVVIYLEDDAQDHRASIIRLPIEEDVSAFVEANFSALWSGASDINDALWEDAADRDDVSDKVEAVLQQIAADIAVIDGGPTNPEMVAIVRRTLVILRKVIRYVSD